MRMHTRLNVYFDTYIIVAFVVNVFVDFIQHVLFLVLDGSCSVDSDCSSALSNTRCCNGTCLCSSGYKPDSLECSTGEKSSCVILT